jgi:hypothetical protein
VSLVSTWAKDGWATIRQKDATAMQTWVGAQGLIFMYETPLRKERVMLNLPTLPSLLAYISIL